MMSPAHTIGVAMVVCLAAALLVLATGGRRRLTAWIAFGATAAASALVVWGAAKVLMHGPGPAVTCFSVPALGFSLRLYVDGLSSVFLLLIATVATLTSLYSIDYLELPAYRHLPAGRYHAYCLLFVAAMYGLVSTTDMLWFFFIFWQLMTLPGYALIRYEGRQHAAAANRYLVMMQVACVATMIGAALLVHLPVVTATGETLMAGDFDAVHHQFSYLTQEHSLRVTAAFCLFLIGFGIKLGMWPFGPVWLPDAHPAAPSPVSAMLSGVMIKTGAYGLLRYFLWLVPVDSLDIYPAAAWGCALAVLGTVTLLVGTWKALFQDQTKRLLAYSSIGQAGYILLALGTVLALLTSPGARARELAALALLAALFHVLNHGLLKSLLFLNAGALLRATGTQDLNRMGGLLRFMPWTATTSCLAALAIGGVPLTNGFASKWGIYIATIQGSQTARWLAVCAIIAILTSALTLAVFVKFVGAAFLDRTRAPRSRGATQPNANDGSWLLWLPQVTLAALCVVLGLVPWLGYALGQRALEVSPNGLPSELAPMSVLSGGALPGLVFSGQAALLVPAAVAILLAATLTLAWVLAHAGGAERRKSPPWLCGYAVPNECHQYSARHYFSALRGLVSAAPLRKREPHPTAPSTTSDTNRRAVFPADADIATE